MPDLSPIPQPNRLAVLSNFGGCGDAKRPLAGDGRDGDLFLAELGGMLRRLASNRLRFSVVRLVLPETVDPTLARKVAASLDSAGVMAGSWHDRSVVGAFFGPRPNGYSGDRLQGHVMAQLCLRAMIAAGEGDLFPHCRLLVTHCWTDEALDIASLIEALGTQGAQNA